MINITTPNERGRRTTNGGVSHIFALIDIRPGQDQWMRENEYTLFFRHLDRLDLYITVLHVVLCDNCFCLESFLAVEELNKPSESAKHA
jgi:hypothetical protein